jgi:hypothetical protein
MCGSYERLAAPGISAIQPHISPITALRRHRQGFVRLGKDDVNSTVYAATPIFVRSVFSLAISWIFKKYSSVIRGNLILVPLHMDFPDFSVGVTTEGC